MREIEVKARVRNKEDLMRTLTACGCVFGEPVSQKDTVYVTEKGSRSDANLRIRIKNEKVAILTAKRQINDLSAVEHELEVSDAKEMEKVILMLGFKEVVRINKTRFTTSYQGCEVCVDEVERLGSFIEIEKMVEGDDCNAEEIQKELFAILQSFGVLPDDRVYKGYDKLITMLS